MKFPDKWIYLASFLCAAGGLFVSFWPLTLLGVAVAVLSGRVLFGLILALLFDIVLGAPTGFLSYIHFPLVIAGLACFLIRYLALRHLLERGGPSRL